MVRTFAKPALMTWDGNNISDHNRDPLVVDVNRIEESTRMANGTMRKYIIADKRSFTTGWTALPQNVTLTVDGFWGKQEIENWWNTKTGQFELKLFYGDGTTEVFYVMMTKYSAELSKRGTFDFWRVSVDLEEV